MRYVTSFADEIGFYKKFKRTQSIADKLNFNIARREANTAKRNAIKRYEQKMISNLTKDNLDVKHILGCISDRSIPPLIENDQIIPDDLQRQPFSTTILHLYCPFLKIFKSQTFQILTI